VYVSKCCTKIATIGSSVEGFYHAHAGRRPPANVKPLVIKLREGAEPVRMSARKYAPPQLNFMRDNIRELEELGLVYKNTGAEWDSPPLILPKPRPDQYRMTVYLRVPNASNKPTAWSMHILQDGLHDLHDSKVFATLDFCQGYWQIPLHKDFQDCQLLCRPDQCSRNSYVDDNSCLICEQLPVYCSAHESSRTAFCSVGPGVATDSFVASSATT
jgi:hypothetical protein